MGKGLNAICFGGGGLVGTSKGLGHLVAFDSEGREVWKRFLVEELGRASGYGGRAQTPIVHPA